MANYTFLFKLILKREFRANFSTKWAYLGFSASILSLLIVLWYTSQAFSPNFITHGQETTYFDFVIIGELFLLIPLVIINSYSRACRTLIYENIFEELFISPISISKNLFLFHLGPLCMDLIRMLTLLLLSSFLVQAPYFFYRSTQAILFQLVGFPVFLALGQLTCAFLIRFGRGYNFVGMILSIFAVLGGVYFPTHVLPSSIHDFFDRFSPFNIILNTSREIIANGWSHTQLSSPTLSLILWGAFLWPISLYILKLSLKSFQKRGLPYLIQ